MLEKVLKESKNKPFLADVFYYLPNTENQPLSPPANEKGIRRFPFFVIFNYLFWCSGYYCPHSWQSCSSRNSAASETQRGHSRNTTFVPTPFNCLHCVAPFLS